MNTFSPWPSFSDEEADAARNVLLSNRVNYWTGCEGREFEKDFAAWCGTDYAVALANGTVALDIALIALGIGEGDEVIVTPRSFIASISAIVNVGATPIFADVSKDSQNITPETVRERISSRTKAIICVHLAGWPCEMDGFLELAREFDLFIIEDCAQAHGATYNGKSVGSFGDIGCWSFCQDKIITTGGEGGMVTTNNKLLWAKMWSYKDHGKSWEAVYEREHPPGFRWQHDSFGTNWRMTEFQAVIGRIQLNRLSGWTAKRQANSARIDSVCKHIDSLYVPELPGNIEHARYKHYVFVKPELLQNDWSRDRIVLEINKRGVPCFHGGCPEVYLEKAFEDTEFRPDDRLSNAKQLGETSLMFLVHPTLKSEEIQKTCDVISCVMAEAARN